MTLKPEDVALIERVKSLCNDWANGENLVITGNVIEDVEDVIELAEHPDPRPSPVGREEVARVIMDNVRRHKSHRHDAKHGRYGVYHFSGVTEAADALLALFSPADGWRALDETVAPLVPVLLWAPPERLYNEPEGKEGEYRIARPRDYSWATYWQPLPPPPGGQG